MVVALAELLAKLMSVAAELTLAVLVIDPWFWGTTLIETLAFPPFAIVPSGQVTVPEDSEHVPWEGVAETKVTPAGSVSVSCVDGALEGPAFWVVSV